MKKLVFISAVIGLVSCNGVKKETSSVSSGKDTTITQKPMIFEITGEETDGFLSVAMRIFCEYDELCLQR